MKYLSIMRKPEFYLSEGVFTKKDDTIERIATRINEGCVVEEIDEILKPLPRNEERSDLRRQRSAGQIIRDGFLTGCTDACLVFVTLARAKGMPAAYVETIEENFLKNPINGIIQGHVFSDVYRNGTWISYNPGNGRTTREGKTYFWLVDKPERRYVEVARGLDFSQLYLDDTNDQIELRTNKQIRELLSRLT